MKKKRLTIDDFDTRQKTEDGVKVFLVHPATGETTEEWLEILGADSVPFRQAQARHNKARLEFIRDKSKKDDTNAQLAFETEAERRLVASLVKGWSLVDTKGVEIKCTPDAVEKFFERAPQVQEQVWAFADNRRNFSNPPLTT